MSQPIEVKAERVEHHDDKGHGIVLTVDGYWTCHLSYRDDEGFVNVELGTDQVRHYVDIAPEDFATVAAIMARAAEIIKGGK